MYQIFLSCKILCLKNMTITLRRVTRGGKGERSPCLFSKIGKKCPNLGKNALIVVIYGLNFSFKRQFLRVSRRKNRRFFPAGPFFLVMYMIVYQSALIPRKLFYPKTFLVTHLRFALHQPHSRLMFNSWTISEAYSEPCQTVLNKHASEYASDFSCNSRKVWL